MSPTTETKTLSFIFGSGILHVTTVAAISMMNLQPQKPKIEMIEFEVATSQGVQTEVPAAPPAPAVAPQPAPALTAPAAPAAIAPVAQALPAKAAVAEPVQEIAAEPVQEVAEKPAQETMPEPSTEIAEVAEITEKTDTEQTAVAEQAVTEAAPVEVPAAVEATEAIVAPEATPVAEAVLATEAAPTSESAAPLVAEVSSATSDAPVANGTEAQATGEAFGVADGVRQLEQLKQRPGNKKPSYDKEDRLRGRQGKVSLLAYISRDGRPVQFKMIQSSGHRSLDLKTLAAVRSWRFYPGQEGWVEIPIQWDLRGGPQEAPATLRRQGIIN